MKKLIFLPLFLTVLLGENSEAALGRSSRLDLGESLKAEPNLDRFYQENQSGVDGVLVI